MKEQLSLCISANAVIMVLLSLYALLIPAVMLICDLRDPGLCGDEMPRCAFRWHQALSPRYEGWARERVACGTATKLTTENISGDGMARFRLGVLSLGNRSLAAGVS